MAHSQSPARSAADGKPQLTPSQRFWREVRGYAEALIIAFLVVTFVFNTVGVVGSSMRPTLNGGNGQLIPSLFTGDRVFIPKYDTWLRRMGVLPHYRRGEIVVVREPANAPSAQLRDRRPFFIKRLIAVPGDHVKIVAGQVFVNDYPIDQGFITDSGEITPEPVDFPVVTQENGKLTGFGIGFQPFPAGVLYPILPDHGFPVEIQPPDARYVQLYYGKIIDSLAPIPADAPENEPFVHSFIVPDGMYFVMGDNRSRGGSEDSRYFGPVPIMSVAGRATAVIWPPRRNGEWNWRHLVPPETFEDVPEPEAVYGPRQEAAGPSSISGTTSAAAKHLGAGARQAASPAS
ncbi:MAG TPA: signal peptidase I [Trueperaceae bacterium]